MTWEKGSSELDKISRIVWTVSPKRGRLKGRWVKRIAPEQIFQKITESQTQRSNSRHENSSYDIIIPHNTNVEDLWRFISSYFISSIGWSLINGRGEIRWDGNKERSTRKFYDTSSNLVKKTALSTRFGPDSKGEKSLTCLAPWRKKASSPNCQWSDSNKESSQNTQASFTLNQSVN